MPPRPPIRLVPPITTMAMAEARSPTPPPGRPAAPERPGRFLPRRPLSRSGIGEGFAHSPARRRAAPLPRCRRSHRDAVPNVPGQDNPGERGAGKKNQRNDRDSISENTAVDHPEKRRDIDIMVGAVRILHRRGNLHAARNRFGQTPGKHHHGQRSNERLDAESGGERPRNASASRPQGEASGTASQGDQPQ